MYKQCQTSFTLKKENPKNNRIFFGEKLFIFSRCQMEGATKNIQLEVNKYIKILKGLYQGKTLRCLGPIFYNTVLCAMENDNESPINEENEMFYMRSLEIIRCSIPDLRFKIFIYGTLLALKGTGFLSKPMEKNINYNWMLANIYARSLDNDSPLSSLHIYFKKNWAEYKKEYYNKTKALNKKKK